MSRILENVLLGTGGNAYRTMAASSDPRPSRVPEFEAAPERLATMWAAPGTLAGGVESSLTQQSRMRSCRGAVDDEAAQVSAGQRW